MLKQGDGVRVFFPPKGEVGITEEMLLFRDVETVITDVLSRNYKSGAFRTFYLEGCNSRMGMPFEFIEDWLIPIDCEV